MFDRVEIDSDGQILKMSKTEFIAIPMAQRLQYLLADNVRFFKADAPVSPVDAMRSLRAEQG